jgi:MFS family permease
MTRLARLLPPALIKPRFQLFSAGQAVSVMGGWIQTVALSWLVYRLTNSVFMLGLTGFLLQIPHLFVAPVAGFIVDRLPRVKFLIAINLTLSFLAAILAVLTLAGVSAIWPYLCVAVLIGTVNACETPARQSLLATIVEDRALLPSAIGVNSMLFNTGRMIGPAIAGILLLRVSEGVCFAVNSVSFAGIVGALIAMRLPDVPPKTSHVAPRAALRETLQHLTALPAARYLLPLASSAALFALPLTQLMPSIAVEFFDGHSGTMGLLMSASGFGALSAAAFIAFQQGYRTQFRLVQIAPAVAGIGLLAFSQSHSLWISLPLLAVIGASVLSTSVSTNTLLQQSVEDQWRGRIIGFYVMCFVGLAPLGNLMAGFLAGHIGLRTTLAINGALMALSALIAQVRLRSNPATLDSLHRSLSTASTSR